jgi:FAD/FMN-containing dehydrogenase
MKGARIDSASRTATIEAGLTQGEVVAKLGAQNLAVPTGSEATVGISGATLGGGFGFLTRNLGMACDNLIGADVVVPSGRNGARVIEVDRHNDPDLLWALRGAGNGNFGIVTSLTYAVHPLSEVAFAFAKWKGFDDLHRVFDTWQRSAPVADNRLTSVLGVDPDAIQLYAVLSSGSPEEAGNMLAPLLAIGKPDVSVKSASWADTFAGFNGGPRQFANWKFHSQFITKPFPPKAISTVGKYMKDAPSPPSNFFCSAFGGAVGRAPRGGSAFPHRKALFYAEPGAGWNGDEITPVAQAWVAEFGQALRPYVDGAYVNVPNAGMAEWEKAYWDGNYKRLRQIKAEYDPHNVFQYEQSIPPAI